MGDDSYKRPTGCVCTHEEGDSDCPVHVSCWNCGELATPSEWRLSPAIVAAVRAYQEAYLEHRRESVLVLGSTRDVSRAWDNLQLAIEADAKERG